LAPTIKYCIFDVIGTIFPWKESFRFISLLEGIGLRSRLPEPELRKLFSAEIEEIFRSQEGFQDFIVKAYGVERRETPGLVDRFDELLTREAEVHPKAETTLRELSEGHCLLVCSDTTGSTKVMLERAGLRTYFQGEYYSNEMHVTKTGGLYGMILKSRPSARPREFVSIGDSARTDVAIPKGMGMRTIWIRNEALGKCQVEPDITVEDLGEVARAVENLG